MKKERKIKLLQYGDLTKIARAMECSDTCVRSALTLRANTEFCSKIRAYVKENKDIYPYVEY